MRWIVKHPDYALTLPLGALCVLLTAVLLVESVIVQRRSAEKAPSSVPTAAPDAGVPAEGDTAFLLPPVEEFSDFVERPLFVEGRKPPPEEEQKQTVEAQDTTPLNLKLMGVMFSPSGEMAILAEGSGKHRRVRKGGTISGWRLVDLRTDHVTVQRGDERKDLMLLKPKPKTTLPGAPGQPPGAVPGAPPARRPPQPPPEIVEPEVEEMEDTGDAGDPEAEDLGETGDEMPEGME